MAERPTKRERRDQARKARLEEQRRRARRRRRQRLTTLLTVLAIAGLIGGLIYMSGQSARKRVDKVNALAREAGCTPIQTYPDELPPDTNHAAAPATVEYKTNPPTSGNHYGNATITGVFDTPRQNEAWVHNLEHGFTGVLYQEGLEPEIRTAVEALVRERNTQTFMQPRPENEEQLVFVAWTKAVRCEDPTDAAKVSALAKAIFEADLGSGAPEAGIGPGTPNEADRGPSPTAQPSVQATAS